MDSKGELFSKLERTLEEQELPVLRAHSPNFVAESLEFVAEMNAKIGFAGSDLI